MAFDPQQGWDDSESQEIIDMSGGEGEEEESGSTHSSMADLIIDSGDDDLDDAVENEMKSDDDDNEDCNCKLTLKVDGSEDNQWLMFIFTA